MFPKLGNRTDDKLVPVIPSRWMTAEAGRMVLPGYFHKKIVDFEK